MWSKSQSNVWFFECSIQGSTLTLDFLLVCSIWLDSEHAKSAGHVWRTFHVQRHFLRREEIEQYVRYRNDISLDISKVLLKMYSISPAKSQNVWRGTHGSLVKMSVEAQKHFVYSGLDYFYNLEEVSKWYIICIPSLPLSLRVRTMPKLRKIPENDGICVKATTGVPWTHHTPRLAPTWVCRKVSLNYRKLYILETLHILDIFHCECNKHFCQWTKHQSRNWHSDLPWWGYLDPWKNNSVFMFNYM